MRSLITTTLAFALAGCASTPDTAERVAGRTWHLVELNGAAVGNAVNGSPPTLLVEAGRVSGNAGCNQFSGGFSGTGREVRFTQLIMTRMYCGGFMELETSYSQALESATHWDVTDNALLILRGDSAIARFRPAG